MSPAPLIMSRAGFLSLPPETDPRHAEAIERSRSHASGVVAALVEFAQGVNADADYSSQGRANRLHAGLAEAATAIREGFSHARRAVAASRDAAKGVLASRTWNGADLDRLKEVQGSLLALFHRDPPPRQLPVDDAGRAVLSAAGPALASLADMLANAPLADSKLIALAALRADPLSRHLLGGPAVLRALENAVTARVVAEDPEAARLRDALDAADALLHEIDGDERTAVASAAKALGLSQDAARSVGRADPIAVASGRKRAS